MSKSTVNRYFSDFKDDGVCVSSSSHSTKSFTRRRSSCEVSNSTGHFANFDLNKNDPLQPNGPQLRYSNAAFDAVLEEGKLGEKAEQSSSQIELNKIGKDHAFVSGTEAQMKFKRLVHFDSDEESDTDPHEAISDLDFESEGANDHHHNKCCKGCLQCFDSTSSFSFKKLPYRVRFKIIVMGLKCFQVTFGLLWTLVTFLEPHLKFWVAGQYKWISYVFLGLYFFLYFTVRFIGCLHGYWKLVTIFIIFTLSLAHVTAVTSITTGSLMMPVILGIILFIGLNYIIMNCRFQQLIEKHSCRRLYRVGIGMFIATYLGGIVICIYMGSLHVDEGTALNKQIASGHCALIIGAFYGVSIIYEIRMFLNGKRLALDGVRDDYILAAVII